MSRLRHYRSRIIALLVVVAGYLALPYIGVTSSMLFNSTLLVGAMAVVLGGLIQSLVMGVYLMAEGTWQVGDTLTVGGPAGPIVGTIVSQHARVTILQTTTGQNAAIPNSALFGATILLGPPPPPPPVPLTTS